MLPTSIATAIKILAFYSLTLASVVHGLATVWLDIATHFAYFGQIEIKFALYSKYIISDLNIAEHWHNNVCRLISMFFEYLNILNIPNCVHIFIPNHLSSVIISAK